MGNGSNKAAKIMKINGEFFKFKLPSKVIDITKDYPDHILLDSQDFLRFNLRAKPLSPQYELKPRKIYLLVELPKFLDNKPKPNIESPLRRSISDLTIKTRSTASIDFDDVSGNIGGSLSLFSSPVGPTRVKMRLPKAQVQKIMEESGDDDVEVSQKIVGLCLKQNGVVLSKGVDDVEERESGGEADVDVRGMCSPCYSYRRKYKKLTSHSGKLIK